MIYFIALYVVHFSNLRDMSGMVVQYCGAKNVIRNPDEILIPYYSSCHYGVASHPS